MEREKNHPGVWLITANGTMYDHANSFAKNGFIDWRQGANYGLGDIVYIYCTRPIMRIMFKCEVVAVSLPFSKCVDDREFWHNKSDYDANKPYDRVRLKLLSKVDTERLSLQTLRDYGLRGNPQRPRGVSSALYKYIESQFGSASYVEAKANNLTSLQKTVDVERYVGKRVFHVSSKFGEGKITAENETTVKIKFDNGVTTTFTKETFQRGLLKIIR